MQFYTDLMQKEAKISTGVNKNSRNLMSARLDYQRGVATMR